MALFYMIPDVFLRRSVRYRFPGSGILVISFVHISHRQLFSRLRRRVPAFGISVIVCIYSNGNGFRLRILKRLNIPRKDCQLLQKGVIHPFHLQGRLDLLSSSFSVRQFLTDHFPGSPVGIFPKLFFAYPYFRIFPGNRPRLAAAFHFCVRLYRLHSFFRYAGIRTAAAEAEIIRASHDKVRTGFFRQIFLHAEPSGKLEGNRQKHHGKGQGYHHQNGFLFIPSQIRKSHTPDPGAPAPALSSGKVSAFRIFYRLYGRHLRRHPAGASAGKEHRNYREQSGHDKDHRRTADPGADFLQA